MLVEIKKNMTSLSFHKETYSYFIKLSDQLFILSMVQRIYVEDFVLNYPNKNYNSDAIILYAHIKVDVRLFCNKL